LSATAASKTIARRVCATVLIAAES
jgi:hypothetical protein